MATISRHHAAAATRGLVAKGFDSDSLYRRVGINPKLLDIPHARVGEHQMTQLIQLIWDTLEDEFMGFTATPCKSGAFSFMTHAIRQCSNLREALRMGTRFYNLFTEDIRTDLQAEGDEASITIRFSQPELDPDHFYLEFWMVIWHRLASWITGVRIPLLYTRLSYNEPGHATELNYLFPGLRHFGQERNQLVFPAEFLQLPLVRSKSDVDQFLIHSPFDLLTIPGDDKSLRHHITHLITGSQALPLEFPGIADLAGRLNISPQTLHRRLQQEGTSYQRIKDNIRRDLALTKLVRDKLPVNEVSALVGFSEPRSFTRAFRHWTGLSPREYCRFV
jgi:AraC-like DNA-binding protein